MTKSKTIKTSTLTDLKTRTDLKKKGSIMPVYTIKLAVMTLSKYEIRSQAGCRIEGPAEGYNLVWFKLSDRGTVVKDASQIAKKKKTGSCIAANTDKYKRAFNDDLLLIASGDHVSISRQEKHITEDITCYIAAFQPAYLNALSQQLFSRHADEITGKAQSWAGLASQINSIEQEYLARLPGHIFMLNNLCAQLAIDSIRVLQRYTINKKTEDNNRLYEQRTVRFIPRDRLKEPYFAERETVYVSRESNYKREAVCKQEKMKLIAQDIRSNCGSDICVANLAIKYQMHPSYLCRCFRAVYQKTILAYRTECRIELACLLLRKDDIRITQIAAICGYRSVSRFSGQFKKLTGMTPTQYRIRLYNNDRSSLL